VSLSHEGKASTGLGLTVCKELVEAHGGRIWVETGHTTGATFSFSVPTKTLTKAEHPSS
jgi:K+-sensing histidine kinase KdpD